LVAGVGSWSFRGNHRRERPMIMEVRAHTATDGAGVTGVSTRSPHRPPGRPSHGTACHHLARPATPARAGRPPEAGIGRITVTSPALGFAAPRDTSNGAPRQESRTNRDSTTQAQGRLDEESVGQVRQVLDERDQHIL
jgi:hypothetical protein